MKGKFLTDCGQVRSHNEDSGGVYYNSTGQTLATIADGMGGHQAGDVASQMTISIIQSKWQECEMVNSPEHAEEWIINTIEKINKSILEQALKKEKYEGMGTTVVIAVCAKDFITIAHIGDSRCYILNENGFKQITEDHSLVNELVRSGQISIGDAEQHPRKNILLKALGTEENIVADVQSLGWEIGDKLLLCSDGLSNKVSNEELFEFIQQDFSINEIGQKMIDLANERGGEDNISLAMIEHSLGEEGELLC